MGKTKKQKAAYARERRKHHREESRAYMRHYMKQRYKNKKHKAAQMAFNQAWRDNNAEHVKAVAHAYYLKNREKKLAYGKAYHLANRDKRNKAARERRAQKKIKPRLHD
jgi:hypothetical protein